MIYDRSEWVADRLRILERQKKLDRQPRFKQRLEFDWRAEQSSRKLLAGEVLQSRFLPYGVSIETYQSGLLIYVGLPEQSINRNYWLEAYGLKSPDYGSTDRSLMCSCLPLRSANPNLLVCCVLDFLDRVLNLRHWGNKPVPIELNIPEPSKEKLWSMIDSKINGGTWDFQEALAAVLKPPPDRPSQSRFVDRANLASILRHEWSPYDYCWGTQKTTYKEACKTWGQWAENLAQKY